MTAPSAPARSLCTLVLVCLSVWTSTVAAQSTSGFYLRQDIGLGMAPSVELLGNSTDRASRCDEFINPRYAEIPGCTDPNRGSGAGWRTSYDRAAGVLAGLSLGYRVGRWFRAEVEWFYRESAYNQTSPVTSATAAGLPNETEIRRNLAATTTSKQGTLHDRLTGYQALGGLDYTLSDAVRLGLKARWMRLGRFSAEDIEWERLRSHPSQLRLGRQRACDLPHPDRRRADLRGFEPGHALRVLREGIGAVMKRLMITCLLLAAPMQAQEAPGRLMLEAGIDGGNSIACPGHYIGIQGRVAGPVSVYASVDNFRCLGPGGNDQPDGAICPDRACRLARAASGARRTGVRRNRNSPYPRRQPDARSAVRRTPDHRPAAAVGQRRGARPVPDRRLYLVLSAVRDALSARLASTRPLTGTGKLASA